MAHALGEKPQNVNMEECPRHGLLRWGVRCCARYGEDLGAALTVSSFSIEFSMPFKEACDN
eukprot:3088873-Amphidinium_carterae.3